MTNSSSDCCCFQPMKVPTSLDRQASVVSASSSDRGSATRNRPHINDALDALTLSSSPTTPKSSSERNGGRNSRISNLEASKNKAALRERERFLVFIRILFKCLDESDPDLRAHAKSIVKECTLKNRQGDPQYTPLVHAVASRLRGVVGEVHWQKAGEYLRHYMIMMKNRRAGSGGSIGIGSGKQRCRDAIQARKQEGNGTAMDIPEQTKQVRA